MRGKTFFLVPAILLILAHAACALPASSGGLPAPGVGGGTVPPDAVVGRFCLHDQRVGCGEIGLG